MRYKNILLLFVLLGCFLSMFVLYRLPSQRILCHCVKMPVRFFPFSSSPLTKITIEGKQYTLLIDTGSSHALDLHKRVLDEIQEKEFIQITRYFDLQGTPYPVSKFQVPEVTLDRNLRLNKLIVHEENIDFLTKGTNAGRTRSFWGKIREQLELFFIDGRIGWPSFEQTACFFDFQNASLFLAKNIEILREEGILVLENFIKVPLDFSKCGPVLSAQTEQGVKKFLLDTGASQSVYKEPNLQSKEVTHLTLNIGGCELDCWDFWPYPMTSELIRELDGILGIDFFKSHRICFDSQGGYIYIQRAKKD